MSNFGFLNLRLVQPFETAFREARSAVGAEELLESAQVFDSVAAAVGDCSMVVGTSAIRDREVHQPVQLLSDAADGICSSLTKEHVAILFGSEKTGLSSDDLDHCNLLLRIPSRDEHASLNLAQAVAITLYELSRESSTFAPEEQNWKAAQSADLDRISSTLLEALRESSYIKGASEHATEQKIVRFVRRMKLSEDDAELWLGMLRKMLWKIRQG